MTRLPRRVTPAPVPPVPPGVALDAAIDNALIPLVHAIAAYAQAGGPDDALPGVRLLYAERKVTDTLNGMLVEVHAGMDDIHGPDGMTRVERLHDLLLGQMLSHHLPDLFAVRAEVAAIRGEQPWEALMTEQGIVWDWAARAADQANEED